MKPNTLIGMGLVALVILSITMLLFNNDDDGVDHEAELSRISDQFYDCLDRSTSLSDIDRCELTIQRQMQRLKDRILDD